MKKRYQNDYVAGRLFLGAILLGLGGLFVLIYLLITGELPKDFPRK